MARYLPETKQEFLNIKGIGEKKYKQFGEQFNAVLTNWIQDHPKEDKAIQINKLIQSGKQIKDIASMRDLTEQTIENHIFKCYKEGFSIPWNIFLSDAEEKEILEVKNTLPNATLRALKEKLSESHTYTKIKAALVKNDFY